MNEEYTFEYHVDDKVLFCTCGCDEEGDTWVEKVELGGYDITSLLDGELMNHLHNMSITECERIAQENRDEARIEAAINFEPYSYGKF